MSGQWLMTQIENNRQIGTTGTTQFTVTIDLPRSNYLGAIGFAVRGTGSASPTLSVDRVRVIANGSAILWDTEGGQLRAIHKYEYGSVPAGVQSTTACEFIGFMGFGRFRRDEDVILPAKLFKSLQLQLTVTYTGTLTAQNLDVWAEEYVSNDDPESKRIRKIAIIATDSDVDANEQVKQKLPLGNFLRAIYLDVDDRDVVGHGSANQIRVLVNNGAEIPFSMRSEMLEAWAESTYRFDDGDVPDGAELDNGGALGTAGEERLYKVDFDVAENLAKVLDTSRMNELVIEMTANGDASDDTVNIITEEIIAVG